MNNSCRFLIIFCALFACSLLTSKSFADGPTVTKDRLAEMSENCADMLRTKIRSRLKDWPLDGSPTNLKYMMPEIRASFEKQLRLVRRPIVKPIEWDGPEVTWSEILNYTPNISNSFKLMATDGQVGLARDPLDLLIYTALQLGAERGHRLVLGSYAKLKANLSRLAVEIKTPSARSDRRGYLKALVISKLNYAESTLLLLTDPHLRYERLMNDNKFARVRNSGFGKLDWPIDGYVPYASDFSGLLGEALEKYYQVSRKSTAGPFSFNVQLPEELFFDASVAKPSDFTGWVGDHHYASDTISLLFDYTVVAGTERGLRKDLMIHADKFDQIKLGLRWLIDSLNRALSKADVSEDDYNDVISRLEYLIETI